MCSRLPQNIMPHRSLHSKIPHIPQKPPPTKLHEQVSHSSTPQSRETQGVHPKLTSITCPSELLMTSAGRQDLVLLKGHTPSTLVLTRTPCPRDSCSLLCISLGPTNESRTAQYPGLITQTLAFRPQSLRDPRSFQTLKPQDPALLKDPLASGSHNPALSNPSAPLKPPSSRPQALQTRTSSPISSRPSRHRAPLDSASHSPTSSPGRPGQQLPQAPHLPQLGLRSAFLRSPQLLTEAFHLIQKCVHE